MDYEMLINIDREIELFVSVAREIISEGLIEEVCKGKEKITLGQVRCLCFIWAHDGVTIGDISRGLGISYPAATKIISRLAEKGLVVRKHNSKDRRNILVEITPKGIEVTTKIKPEKLKRLGSLLEKMDPEDLRHLVKGIKAFLSVAVVDKELFGHICLHCGKEHVQNCILSDIKCQKIINPEASKKIKSKGEIKSGGAY